MNPTKPAGPDPAVQEAIKRLTQTQLSPLEEQLFNGWMAANGMDAEEMGAPDHPIDFRNVYKESGGQVLPVGQLQKQAEKQADIQTLMQAQEAHDQASPIQALMGGQGKPPQGGGMPPMGGGDPSASGSY